MISASSQVLRLIWKHLILEKFLVDFEFKGVSIHSSSIKPGGLFFAFSGNKHHGIEFVDEAKKQGAVAVITEKPAYRLPLDLVEIVVSDIEKTFVALAVWWRGQCHQTKFIAITGSYGKTTVCQIIGQLLSHFNQVCYTNANQNNELGVPLNILSVSQDDRWAVLELGARRRGDIEKLARYCLPDVAIITGIGESHLEEFGDVESIFLAKTELLMHLGKTGVAVLPKDRRYEKRWKALSYRFKQIVWFDIQASDLKEHWRVIDAMNWDDRLQRLEFCPTGSSKYLLKSPFLGEHMLSIFSCVFSVLSVLRISLNRLLPLIPILSRIPRRFDPIDLGRVLIIDDAYNASPMSMCKALETFSKIQADQKIAILGEMSELGDHSKDMHQQVLNCLRGCSIDYYFGFGQGFSGMEKYVCGQWYNALEELVENVVELVSKLEDQRILIFCKASNQIRFDRLVKNLVQQLS